MLFHYALVDDLITKEEFERRVEVKMDECGDLIDEPTAAMMVIGDLGRAHVRIRDLSGKSSLFSFFGKVIDKIEPKIFDRADGEEGAVATLLLGDETGSVRVVLWDERAGAAEEIAIGDVLEVIGRHPGKSQKEIYALALRKASCQIECCLIPGTIASLRSEPLDLEVLVLVNRPPRAYSRRDGSQGELAEALVADVAGTAKIVAWEPDLLSGIPVWATIHITGAKPNTREEGRAYSLDEKSTVTRTETTIPVPFASLDSVAPQGIYTIKGKARHVREPRSFITRSGKTSWVRNIIVNDGTDDLKVVLWGENALLPIIRNDPVEIYHATAKPGRSADIELHAGKDSSVRVPGTTPRQIIFEGTVTADSSGIAIDSGKERYLPDGADLPPWQDVRITGVLTGYKIRIEHWEPAGISPEYVQQKLAEVKKKIQME